MCSDARGGLRKRAREKQDHIHTCSQWWTCQQATGQTRVGTSINEETGYPAHQPLGFVAHSSSRPVSNQSTSHLRKKAAELSRKHPPECRELSGQSSEGTPLNSLSSEDVPHKQLCTRGGRKPPGAGSGWRSTTQGSGVKRKRGPDSAEHG